MIRRRLLLPWLPVAALAAGCAALGGRDPPQVYVVAVEPQGGESAELRFLCKLRVLNPNDTPIEFNGIYLDLEVQGSTLASGVSDASGTIPRFGEALLEVPVTASGLRIVRQALIFLGSTDRTLAFVLRGKLAGPVFSAVRFESRGELRLPVPP
jgi:LEA14-like dessication related protein